MPAVELPLFGNILLCGILVCAAYTFAVSLMAGRGRRELLPAARAGVYATAATTALAVLVLAYAFQAHDFRIRYVLRYSDRAMEWWYLIASLWGGQDGSILWWTFLLGIYSTICAFSLRGKLPELQPYILATLMSIVMFFGVLMLFAANPFSMVVAGAPPDGEGLNPLLQNYWMMIHPPMLYLGMTGWAVPFAFVVAALITGRLGDEWIHASRRWTLWAFAALAVGNVLGMLWSYEELGWGGYWAWDPVENAAFMPLLPGIAFLHSVMLQERRGMFKVWNVFLLCLTFFMTIFGTFLTRSGMIASVHSFAKSSIGIYFVWYMVGLAAFCAALIIWRLPQLRAEHRIDSLLSRDFVFLLNNWILMGMLFFVLIATTWPLISEAVRDETVTVGPGFYNKWMIPLGLILMSLTGVGPLLAWRKSTGAHLTRVLRAPAIGALAVMVLHVAVGPALGYPPVVEGDEIYDTLTGKVLAGIYGASPVLSTTFCGFVLVGHLQEFWRGARVRMKNAEKRGGREGFFTALYELVSRAKRRYGGYLVHLGLVAMYFGFTGAAYDQDTEAALRPGESLKVADYEVRYDGSRMEVEPGRRMIFTDMTVLEDGQRVGRVSPAKFVYDKPPGTATTEVAIRVTPKEDIYAIMNTVNPTSKVGTFRVIVRPFVAWIWIGGLLMIFGTAVCMAPSVREVLGRVRMPARSPAATAAATLMVILLGGALLFAALAPATASAQSAEQGSSSLHAGSVTMRNTQERQLFERLLCECGDCQRLPLSTCACSWAEDARARIRGDLAEGKTPLQVQEEYREEHGAQAIAIPADEGLDRLLWAVPVGLIGLAAVQLFRWGRRWSATRGEGDGQVASTSPPGKASNAPDDPYDDALDAELQRLEDES
ncbi:MAG: cytochrome c-type biogenesis CcmF C-terminal domain-containing protein [Myxococcales bacterium]|jgi:cytochrome c-type biogenesis protein CcmF